MTDLSSSYQSFLCVTQYHFPNWYISYDIISSVVLVGVMCVWARITIITKLNILHFICNTLYIIISFPKPAGRGGVCLSQDNDYPGCAGWPGAVVATTHHTNPLPLHHHWIGVSLYVIYIYILYDHMIIGSLLRENHGWGGPGLGVLASSMTWIVRCLS